MSIDQIKSIPTSFATLSLPLDETALTVIPVSASVPQTLSAVAFVPLEARSCYFRARRTLDSILLPPGERPPPQIRPARRDFTAAG